MTIQGDPIAILGCLKALEATTCAPMKFLEPSKLVIRGSTAGVSAARLAINEAFQYALRCQMPTPHNHIFFTGVELALATPSPPPTPKTGLVQRPHPWSAHPMQSLQEMARRFQESKVSKEVTLSSMFEASPKYPSPSLRNKSPD